MKVKAVFNMVLYSDLRFCYEFSKVNKCFIQGNDIFFHKRKLFVAPNEENLLLRISCNEKQTLFYANDVTHVLEDHNKVFQFFLCLENAKSKLNIC